MPTATAKPTTRKKATVTLVACEVWCPCCDRDDPIPATDGSFMWDRLPETVTCPSCKETSAVSRKVSI